MEWKTLLFSLPLVLIAALAILWASRALDFLAGKNSGSKRLLTMCLPEQSQPTDPTKGKAP